MSTRVRLTKILNQPASRRRQAEVTATTMDERNRRPWMVVRGDKVQVIGDHAEAGKQGVVRQVLRKQDRVIVQGVNLAAHHIKGNVDKGIKGRTVERERSLPYSQVSLVDPVTGKPTRAFHKILEDGAKVRVAKASGAIIPRPEILAFRKRPVNSVVTESDTLDEDVWQITYEPK